MLFLKSTDGDNSVLVKRVRNGGGRFRLVELPIPNVPPPTSIGGLSQIILNCFDAKVLSFLRAISTILMKGVCLVLDSYALGETYSKWKKTDQQSLYNWKAAGEDRHNLAALQCLMRAFPHLERTIKMLCIGSGTNVVSAELFARLLTNVRNLFIKCPLPAPKSLLLTGIYCRNCSPYIPVLVEWLHTPAMDGEQKVASFDIGNTDNLAAFVTQLQQHFLCAEAPIAYFVRIISSELNYASVELPFSNIRNERTNEVLSLRHRNGPKHEYHHCFVLFRCCAYSATAKLSQVPTLDPIIIDSFWDSMYLNIPPNTLALNVAQMSEMDEPLIPMESEVDDGLDERDGNEEPGPSHAKKARLCPQFTEMGSCGSVLPPSNSLLCDVLSLVAQHPLRLDDLPTSLEEQSGDEVQVVDTVERCKWLPRAGWQKSEVQEEVVDQQLLEEQNQKAPAAEELMKREQEEETTPIAQRTRRRQKSSKIKRE